MPESAGSESLLASAAHGGGAGGNSKPVARPGADPREGIVPQTVHLFDAGSYDPDGTIVKWEWHFDSAGGQQGDTGGWQDYTPTKGELWHAFNHPGTVVAHLRVTDDDGRTATAFVKIHLKRGTGGRGDWWAFGREETHNRRSPFNGPDSPWLEWRTYIGKTAYNSPVIAEDGTVYITSLDYNLYAIAPDTGAILWAFATGSRFRNSPVIGPGGTIYAASEDGYLYAIDPSGNQLWRHQISTSLPHDANSSPIIAPDGTVYVGSNTGQLYAINPDGTLKWSYATDDEIQSSPAVGPDGTVYVGSADHYLYAINADGSLKWRYQTSWRIITSSPAIAADGTVYIGNTNGGGYSSNFYAINPNGSLKWRRATDGYVYSSPGIGADGTVYFSDVRPGVGSLYACNPDGSLQWKLPLGDESYSSPSIDADGTIYVGSGYISDNANRLNAVNPDGTFKWHYNVDGWVISSPAISDGGALYFGGEDGYLYKLSDAGGSGPSWIHTWGGVDRDNIHSVAVAQDGSVFASGNSKSFGTKGKAILLKFAADGTPYFSKTWGGGNGDTFNSILSDPNGYLYAAGDTYSYGNGWNDTLLVKLDQSGNVVWQKIWGGGGGETTAEAVFDSQGNILLGGYTVTYGPSNRADACLLKYSPGGALLSQVVWGAAQNDNSEDNIAALAVDGSDNAYLAGRIVTHSAHDDDVLLLKFDPGGALVWGRRIGGSGYERGDDLAWDTSGSIYVAGVTSSAGAGARDALLQKLDVNGNLLWQRTWGSSGDDRLYKVRIDSQGRILTAGYTTSAGGTGEDLVLLVWDSAGSLLSSKSWATGGGDGALALHLLSTGDLLMGGTAPDIHGSWQPALGSTATANLTATAITGVTEHVNGAQGTPGGVMQDATATWDSGGGERDALLMKATY